MKILYSNLIELFPKIITEELREKDYNSYLKFKEFADILTKLRDGVFKSYRERTDKENISILDITELLDFRKVNPNLLDMLIQHYDVILYCDDSEITKRRKLYTNIVDKKSEGLIEYFYSLVNECFPSKPVLLEDFTENFTGWDENCTVKIENGYTIDFNCGKIFNELDAGASLGGYTYFLWIVGAYGLLVNIVNPALWTSQELDILYKIVGQNKAAYIFATVGYFQSGGIVYTKVVYGKDPVLWLNPGDSLPYQY